MPPAKNVTNRAFKASIRKGVSSGMPGRRTTVFTPKLRSPAKSAHAYVARKHHVANGFTGP